MEYTKPKETLPALITEGDTKALVVVRQETIRLKLIAVIPPKVSGPKGPVDPEALGKHVDVFA